MENQLFINNLLFIIPSWSKLLGFPTLGTYLNQKVSKIHTDLVIFLGGTECAVKTEQGTLHYLFGLGYYYLKFELEPGKSDMQQRGKYVVDSRRLTGIVLSDFVYDRMARSKNITLENDRDVIIAEDVIKVPINIAYKSSAHKTFIKGALMRNVFIPYKDIILEMMGIIWDPYTYQLKDMGHMLLNAHWDQFNKITISDKMKAFESENYKKPTAGLNEIIYGADQHLNEAFTEDDLQDISDHIQYLKSVYSSLEYDPMYLFSIIINAATILKPELSIPSKGYELTFGKIYPKESVFISAEDRIDSIIDWPEKYKRNEIQEIKTTSVQDAPLIKPAIKGYVELTDDQIAKVLENGVRETSEEDKFQLRTMKSETVESKALPLAPEGDLEEILLYIKYVIEENYDMQSIGRAFGYARDNIRKIMLQSDHMWEMSKYANIYQKKELNLGLPIRDKRDLLDKLNGWIKTLEEERQEKERLEKERLEQERLEKERLEKERLEKERLEQERLEREKRERESLERERLEQEKLEKERQLLEEQRLENERLEKFRQEQERVRLEKERLEKESIEKERLEKERLERERIEREQQEILEQERLERESLERARQEIEEMKQQRKELEKKKKLEAKKQKKLDKEKKKLQKMKEKEEKKLKTL